VSPDTQTLNNTRRTDASPPGPALNAYNDLHPLFGDTLVSPPAPDAPALPLECLLVIDSGFSHTTITPLYNGRPLQRAIRRLDFGGKHLTNLLKEVVSVRYFDLHQDVKVVNDIKEDVCFVSQDFKADMEKTWKGNIGRPKAVKLSRRAPPDDDEDEDDSSDEDAMDTGDETSDPCQDADQPPSIDYVLPDGLHIKRGFARPHNPLAARASNKNKRKLHASGPESSPDDDNNYVSMTLSSERFTIPEILFSPSDTGSTQPGLAACVIQSLSVLPRALQASLLGNILVVGGNAKMPRFVQRVQREVRMQAPSEFVVRVRKMEDPVTSTWLGGARMAGNREVVRQLGVSREEYFEHGSAWVGRRFGSGGGGGSGVGK
jgi:actin-related protein 6